MKLKKQRVDGDGVAWTAVRLSRRERLEVYRTLARTPTAEAFPAELKHIPPQQIELIVKEFRPGAPRVWAGANDLAPVKTGIHGNQHFCEAGCGAVIAKKDSEHVFVRPAGPRKFYVCEVCKARLDREKAEYEKSLVGVAPLAKAVHEALKEGV